MTSTGSPPHHSADALLAGLDHIRLAPADGGRLELIVRRPSVNAREVLQQARLDSVEGLVGDSWNARASSRTPDRSPHPDMQLNIMGARVIGLLAHDKGRWALAGDQLYLDMDLSAANLPAGTRLRIGRAVIEVTAQPHTGCAKFVERFGFDALTFVNSPLGRELNLRGINARVVQPGVISTGDLAHKISADVAGPVPS